MLADFQVASPEDRVLREESIRDLREISGFCGFGRLRQHQLFVSRQFLPIRSPNCTELRCASAFSAASIPVTLLRRKSGLLLVLRSVMQPDDKLCYCFHVTQRKIVNFIRLHQPRVPSEVSECGGAGTGCGWCVPFLKKLFDAAKAQREAAIEMSPEEYARERADYVRAGKGKPPGAGP